MVPRFLVELTCSNGTLLQFMFRVTGRLRLLNVCSIWPFAQISDDFYYLGIWQCAIYFVAALFKELALITIRDM